MGMGMGMGMGMRENKREKKRKVWSTIEADRRDARLGLEKVVGSLTK
jgi:hypothetical protein